MGTRLQSAGRKASHGAIRFQPLTADNWPDLERLFGAKGACGGCWCMAWRLARGQWERQKGTGNKKALRSLVETGNRPGLIAYRADEPVGWCAVAPRAEYPVLDRSRTLARVDDRPVWSITCFFVAKAERRRGVSAALLRAAVDFARRHGARIVEGYPMDLKKDWPDPFVWTGLASSFRTAGFTEVLRRSPTRPIMRKRVAGDQRTQVQRTQVQRTQNH